MRIRTSSTAKCVLALALSVACAAVANTVASAATATHTLSGCDGKPAVRPASVVLACGDGNGSAAGMHWTGWGEAVATGTGTETYNDCTPNCAAGHEHTRPISLIVNGVKKCPDGSVGYDTIVIVGSGDTYAIPRPVCGATSVPPNSGATGRSILLHT